METQVLSSSVSTAGVPLFSSLPEEGVTGNSKRVLGMAELNQETAEPWIRVEPWDTLLCCSAAVGDEEEQGGEELFGGPCHRQREELEDRRLAGVVLVHHDQVAQDVRRTRSDTAVFREEGAREWLQRCVILFCQERGLQYVQGLSELAAPWAFISDPPSLNGFSFRCFSRFLDRFAPYMFSTVQDPVYKDSLGKVSALSPLAVLETHLALFDQLLRYHDPALAFYLEACGLTPDAYATPWFVTVFARQTPIPTLLKLWERLVQSGDPLLHQFLALAWLLRNRRVLLETRIDDVPEAVSRLRLQSEEDLKSMWETAEELRRSTPRMVCEILRALCYEKDWGVRHSEMLRALKATGMVVADADQVAELVMSAESDAGTTAPQVDNIGAGKDKAGGWGGASTEGGRFVLVDCRSGGAPRGTELPRARPASVKTNGLSGKSAECVGPREGRVVWHTIDPTAFLGRESVATADLMRSVSIGGGPVEGSQANGGAGLGRAGLDGVEGSKGFALNGMGVLVEKRSTSGSASSFTAPTTAAGLPVTHVCFVGAGGGRGAWERGHLAADPAVRLARAAARSGLARVCVLDGGFASFEEALARRTCHPRDVEKGAGVGHASRNSDSAPGGPPDMATVKVPLSPAGKAPSSTIPDPDPDSERRDVRSEPHPDEQSKTSAASSGSSSGSGPETVAARPPESTQARPAAGPGANGDDPTVTESPTVDPGQNQTQEETTSPEMVAQNSSTMSQTAPAESARAPERRVYRISSSSRISEPFRVYASKSASDMGRALRALPASAGKPLEDAARVCDSLAKTNVRVLGESRVSLTRSLTRMEQLDARMSGTVGSLTRHLWGRHR